MEDNSQTGIYNWRGNFPIALNGLMPAITQNKHHPKHTSKHLKTSPQGLSASAAE